MRRRLTAKRLRQVLDYDPETGIFTWRIGHRQGVVAGHLTRGRRRVVIGIEQAHYYAHRLAWLYVHGRWPRKWINHRDGNEFSNAIANLREATRSQVSWAGRARRNNKSGHKGVYLMRDRKRWCASITTNGNRRFLGYFDTEAEARRVYKRAEREQRGEFATA